jgi:hypothetical protein
MKASYKMNRNGLKRGLVAFRMLVAVFALALACGAAKADTIGTYTVNGTLASGGTVTGSFTFDYSAWSGGINPITAVDITADGVNFTGCPGGSAGTCNLYTDLNGGTADGFGVSDPTGFTYIDILWDAVDLTNPPYTLTLINTSFCVDCGTNGTLAPWGMYYDQLVSGTAVDPPGVPTPENGTLSMLLAGLIGLSLFATWQSRRGKLAGQRI